MWSCAQTKLRKWTWLEIEARKILVDIVNQIEKKAGEEGQVEKQEDTHNYTNPVERVEIYSKLNMEKG